LECVLKVFGLVRASREPDPRLDLYFVCVDRSVGLYRARFIVENKKGSERIEVRGIEVVAPGDAGLVELGEGDVNARGYVIASRFRRLDIAPYRVSLPPGKQTRIERYVGLKAPAREIAFKIDIVVMSPKGERPRTIVVKRPVHD
jgi:hypothetical protein